VRGGSGRYGGQSAGGAPATCLAENQVGKPVVGQERVSDADYRCAACHQESPRLAHAAQDRTPAPKGGDLLTVGRPLRATNTHCIHRSGT
jgi:hypothetical protein